MRLLARAGPISRGSRWVPPSPGMTPSRISGTPNLAFSPATRKSAHSASSRPPPSAEPVAPLLDVRAGREPLPPAVDHHGPDVRVRADLLRRGQKFTLQRDAQGVYRRPGQPAAPPGAGGLHAEELG